MHLPLRRLALCLDCETCFEMGTSPCPVCGGDSWALLARFLNQGPLNTLSRFQPLPKSLAERPKHREGVGEPAVKQLLIISRDRQKLYEHVKRAFSDNATVEVIFDRRTAESRNAANASERRRGDQQQRLETDNHLKALGWAIVRLDVFRTTGLPHRGGSR